MIEISFGSQVCGELTSAASREWLVPDGLGGYAMGTVGGLRTRRYHGLLVVPGDTPASRKVGLVSLDPAVLLPSGARVRLGAHEWVSGDVDPRGFELLERFDLTDGLPRWRWRVGDVVIEREVATLHGRSCVAVVHRLVSGGPVELELAAACTWRDAHGERRADGPPLRMDPVDGGVLVEEAYRLSGPGWTPQGHWWRGVYHREEAARGLHPEEDLWYAGQFRDTLRHPGDTVSVLAWAGDLNQEAPPGPQVVSAARQRNRQVVAAARPADTVEATLTLAADAFVVRTATGPDVVAGYPWFGAWSRDTMISYEGLLLRTGRADLGRELLRSYAATLSEGMLANTADTGRVEYNTVDGTLWFLHAVSRHVTVTGDTDLGDELLPALRSVIDAHLAGTRYGIAVDPADGLLTQGAPGAALTWMDARVYGVPVTPRHGKPVEVNALWINGVAGVAELAELAGQDADGLHRLHERAVKSFRDRFPTPAGWLHDVIDAPAPVYPLGGAAYHDDDLLRPNQLLAWSLPFAPLQPDPRAVSRVGAGLLTPLGPRSLSPECPGFTGRHRGGPAERDTAYHQGTVWPWLIGPYADAARRAGLPVDTLCTGLEAHLTEYGLGSVSETADGAAPHTATGCPFQAWSVAELLRARR
ncbi:glycogen debranching enzyme, putative [Micromonospora phaseoli]|uniref:Glycogen debranching enzyme, putative n=1 Tax=Micromonospora phaseoli TaxID=1144548 RepID=A0A1H7DTH6_9ACTN|nr:amylo-alpha-1,6-glucosidase [Micromonospora phaseoli]PZV89461.1 putative glycogen debranching enzyme [Micromonospora phaseoli]GIJ80284.1 glycogen debranching protein [Micromonospora phaseoli]SEK02982.1 glycogen debranching enzyme, putative [Micromonospora phaseoli]